MIYQDIHSVIDIGCHNMWTRFVGISIVTCADWKYPGTVVLKLFGFRTWILKNFQIGFLKNIFKAYIPHQNRYVPQDALEIYAPHHLASSYGTLFSIKSIS